MRDATIDECIKIVKGLIRSSCDDHTPFYGPCISCGNSNIYEVLPDPETVIEALEALKIKT